MDHYLELHAASGDPSAASGAGADAGSAGHGAGDQQAASAAAVAPVRCLMALAAIAQTDADLLMPPGSVTCYVKRLSLYLKVRWGGEGLLEACGGKGGACSVFVNGRANRVGKQRGAGGGAHVGVLDVNLLG